MDQSPPARLDQTNADSPCWRTNIDSLATHWPDLCQRVLAHQERLDVSAVVRNEPWPGITEHLQTVPPGAQGLVFCIGMGLGYAPLLMLRERPELAQIAILEPCLDIFRAALLAVDLRPLLTDRRVVLLIGDPDWEAMEQAVSRVAALEDTHILRHLPSFEWRQDIYGPVSDSAYMILNQLNASGSTTRKCGSIFMENRFSLLTLLRHAHSLDLLRDRFQGRPAVLVAAGPSLARSIPDLREVAGRCVLIAADSALAPLLKAGIVPDFVTSIDYLDLNFEKLAPFTDQEWPLSLVTSIKATPLIPKRFPAKHIFFAFAEDQPQEWIIEALGVKTLTATSSSVAHLSLGLALVLGCDPVIFTGQDLSYTAAVGDHAEGTIIMRDDLPTDREIFLRPAVGGGTMPTDRQLLSLLKQFEDIIAATPRRYINATAAGLHIQGTEAISLAEAAATYCPTPLPVGALIDRTLAAAPPALALDRFVAAAGRKLASVTETLGELARAIALSAQVTKEIDGLKKKQRPIDGFSALSPRVQDLLARFDALNSTIDNMESTWVQVLELTFAMLSDNDQRRKRNERLRSAVGYLPWLAEELQRITTLNHDRQRVLQEYAAGLQGVLAYLDAERPLIQASKPHGSMDLAALFLKAGLYRDAHRLLADPAPGSPPDALFLLLSGEAKAGLLHVHAALDEWARAVAADPGLEDRVTALKERFCGEWLGFAERYGNADEGGDNFPHLLAVWLQRVSDLLGEETALPTRLLELWASHRPRIEAWLTAGRIEPAAVTLNGWQVFSARLPEFSYLLARLFALKGDHAAAVLTLAQAIAHQPDRPDWLALMARELIKAGRFSEAIATLTKAIALDPGTATIWEEIGDLLAASRDYAGAILAYERCFLALPHRVDALCKMGHSYLNSDQPEAAIAAFDAALAQAPGLSSASLGLARAHHCVAASSR